MNLRSPGEHPDVLAITIGDLNEPRDIVGVGPRRDQQEIHALGKSLVTFSEAVKGFVDIDGSAATDPLSDEVQVLWCVGDRVKHDLIALPARGSLNGTLVHVIEARSFGRSARVINANPKACPSPYFF